MKRFLAILAISLIAGANSAMAWSKFGHEVIIELAKRHISEKTKANIAKYMPNDITDDAIYMDDHRHDKELAYSTNWHGYSVDDQYEYDMNPRLAKGDVIHAMRVADHNLSKLERLTDSAVVMNIRWLIHFAGDMHCPSHSYLPGPRLTWACECRGVKFDSFHTAWDEMPSLVHPNKSCVEVAAEIDTASKREIKQIQSGDILEWAKEIAINNKDIFKWNKPYTVVLDPKTPDYHRDHINLQLRHAGYRLAYLLNRYFGE